MKKFKLEIELGNETMKEGMDVARALREAASILDHYVEGGMKPGLAFSIRDENGNTVGRWRVRLLGQHRGNR